MRAVVLEAFGEPDVLTYRDWPEPVTSDGEVIVDVTLSGVNFSDTLLRRIGIQTTVDAGGRPNWVRPESLPLVLGGEVLGRVDGQRVVALCGTGGYAQRVAVPTDRIFAVPDEVSDPDAICLFVQGLTAWFALRHAARLTPGESVAIQAAAGGVGSLAVQIARELGAGPIVGVASTERKQAFAKDAGSTSVVKPGAGLGARLLEANENRPYDVVLESSGAPEFDEVCAVLARFGRLVSLGSASGQPGQVDTRALIASSRSVVGFWLLDYLQNRERAVSALDHLFDLVVRGAIIPLPVRTFALEDAAEAHRAIESRDTSGKSVLKV